MNHSFCPVLAVLQSGQSSTTWSVVTRSVNWLKRIVPSDDLVEKMTICKQFKILAVAILGNILVSSSSTFIDLSTFKAGSGTTLYDMCP